ncbi:MAG: transcriptional repressor [Gammaproteobacteria bacterium]|nr:transcriptional repressor [Gammaproteobacteria bacterium]
MMHRHNHDDCMEHALQAAESICAGQNIRLTPIRKRILELICASHQAIGAYQLLDQLKLEDSKAKPATVYRALDFLMDAGLVHKVESLNAYIGCLTADKDHHSAILICKSCNNAFEIDAEVCYSDLFEKSRSFGFTPHELTLELRGVCVDCQAKA